MTAAIIPLLLFIGALLLPCHVIAYLPDFPRQTTAADRALAVQSWSPRPTDNPAHLPQHIFARQDNPNFPNFPGDARTALVAPDNTCGYISGLQGAPFSCGTGFKCVFFSATSSSYGLAACCTSGVTCKIRTQCVDSTAYSTGCDNGCQLDAFTLKCTNSAKPYCGRIQFSSPNIQDYWCLATKPTATYLAATSYSNQPLRLFQTVDKSLLWPITTQDTSSQSSGQSRSSSTITGDDASPTSDESAGQPTASNNPSSRTPTAIIGGVVGGVVFAAIASIGAFLFWKRRKGATPKRTGGAALEPYSAHTGGAETQHESRQDYALNPVQPYDGYQKQLQQQQYDPYKAQPVIVPYSEHQPYQQYYDPPKPQELQGRQDPQELHSQPLRWHEYNELPAETQYPDRRQIPPLANDGNEPGSPFRDSQVRH